MRMWACMIGVMALAQLGGCPAPEDRAAPAPWIMASGNQNNLCLVIPEGPDEFRFWQRDARGVWCAGGLWRGQPAAIAVWREDLLVVFDSGRWGMFGLAGSPKIQPPIAPDWKPAAACEDGLATDAFGWDAAAEPILARYQNGQWTWTRVPADIPAGRVRDAQLVRFAGRPCIVWREEAEPLVGETPGYRVRFAFPEEGKWTVVTSRVRVASAPLVASDGQHLIFLYRKPGEGAAAGPWTLATWSRDDEDWHEAAAVTGTIPEGPIALARQGSQFLVAVLTETGPQVATLDVPTGRLEPFAVPALGQTVSAPGMDQNLMLLLGLGLLTLLVLTMSLNRARAAASSPAPPPAAVAVTLAPIWRRAVAGIIDYILISFIIAPAMLHWMPESARRMAAGEWFSSAPLPPRELAILLRELAISLVLQVLVFIFYYGALEAASGQTLGKRLLGLQVVTDSGGRITLWAAVVRNLLRVVDSLPGVYLVGLLSMIWSPKLQRLGDRLGHTMVILKPKNQALPKPPPL